MRVCDADRGNVGGERFSRKGAEAWRGLACVCRGSGPHGSRVIPACLLRFAGRGGHESSPNPAKPCIQTGLTHSHAVEDPIRATFAPFVFGMKMRGVSFDGHATMPEFEGKHQSPMTND
jgi:hypothetical protein